MQDNTIKENMENVENAEKKSNFIIPNYSRLSLREIRAKVKLLVRKAARKSVKGADIDSVSLEIKAIENELKNRLEKKPASSLPKKKQRELGLLPKIK